MSEEIQNEFPLDIDISQFVKLENPSVTKLKKVLKFIQEAFDIKFKAGFHSVKIKVSNADLTILPWNVICIEKFGQKIRIYWDNDKEKLVTIQFKIGSYKFVPDVYVVFQGRFRIDSSNCDVIIELEPESLVYVYTT